MSAELEKIFLRKIFSEIVARRSVYQFSGKNVYVKHRGIISQLESDAIYQKTFEKLSGKIFTESEKLNYLISENLWPTENEKKISDSKDILGRLYENKNNCYSEKDIIFYNSEIKKEEDFLIEILSRRAELIGETVEIAAQKSADLFTIQNSLFSDSDLTKNFYSKEEFENLSVDETENLFIFYQKFVSDTGEQNIKKICIQNFFRELFCLSENLMDFFGGAITQLSFAQSKILTYGRHFSNIFQNFSIPADIASDPEKIEQHASGKKNIDKILEKSGDSGVVSIPGLTKKDLQKYGLESPVDHNEQVMKKLKEAPRGELSFEESIRLGLIPSNE